MTGRQKLGAAATAAVVLGGLVAVGIIREREGTVDVRIEAVARRDLVAAVTASGNIRARRSVDLSSDIMGRVVELAVAEGDEVEAGEVVLRLEATRHRAAVARARAALSQAEAAVAQRKATLRRVERERDRLRTLSSSDSTLISRQELDDAETSVEVARADLDAAEHGVRQAAAALAEADDGLSKTVLRAPISGKVTRLNIEEGETAVVGTMNNPGSLLLTISDLSVVEALLEVDETDVPDLSLGDTAVVEIDAFPDRRFSGTVTRIGQSAVRSPTSAAGIGSASAVSFEVVVTLGDPPVLLRPDLSATADIVTAVRENALSIPIISLAVREGPGARAPETSGADPAEPGGRASVGDARSGEEEGVFRVQGGRATFVPVRVGIAGQEYFEILSGVAAGDSVVAGPYREIREMEEGTRVRRMHENADSEILGP